MLIYQPKSDKKKLEKVTSGKRSEPATMMIWQWEISHSGRRLFKTHWKNAQWKRLELNKKHGCYVMQEMSVVEQTNEADDINNKNNKRLAEEEQGSQENVWNESIKCKAEAKMEKDVNGMKNTDT